MAGLTKELGIKKRVRRETVNLPAVQFNEGDQVFLGADVEGNSRLVPWDINCPKWHSDYGVATSAPNEVRRNQEAPNESSHGVRYLNGGGTGNKVIPSKLQFTWELEPGTWFIIGSNEEPNGWGDDVCGAYVVRSVDLNIGSISVSTSATLQTSNVHDFYGCVPLAGDATYWIFFAYTSTGTTTREAHLIRVHKTTYAVTVVDQASGFTAGTHGMGCIVRVDESNERVWLKGSDDLFFRVVYDASLFTIDAATTVTSASTLDTWGIPGLGTQLGTDHFWIDPDDNTITYFWADGTDTGLDGSGTRHKVGVLWKMVHDGTRWHSSLISEEFRIAADSVPAYQKAFQGLGGGYYFNLGGPTNVRFAAAIVYIGDNGVVDLPSDNGVYTGHTLELGGPSNATQPVNQNIGSSGRLTSESRSAGMESAGFYKNGLLWHDCDSYYQGRITAGLDMKYIRAFVQGNPYQYGQANPTYENNQIVPFNTDDDYIFCSNLYASASGLLTGFNGMVRFPKPCQYLSTKPIGRCVTSKEVGAYSVNLLKMNATPSDGDTVTLDDRTYTFKTTLTPTANEVLIGGSAAVALDNLYYALGQSQGSGTSWAADTAIHATINPVTTGVHNGLDTLTIASKYRDGVAYSCTETGSGISFDFTTTQDGVAGHDVEIEFYEGVEDIGATADSYASYGGERYEMKLTEGTFDMSHCEVSYWVNFQYRDAGTTSPQSDDIRSFDLNGPVVLETQEYSNTADTVDFPAESYAFARGRRLMVNPHDATTEEMLYTGKRGVLK